MVGFFPPGNEDLCVYCDFALPLPVSLFEPWYTMRCPFVWNLISALFISYTSKKLSNKLACASLLRGSKKRRSPHCCFRCSRSEIFILFQSTAYWQGTKDIEAWYDLFLQMTKHIMLFVCVCVCGGVHIPQWPDQCVSLVCRASTMAQWLKMAILGLRSW